jgi:DNA-binding NarL/FixJ family response regulator
MNAPDRALRVLVVDDNPVIRIGLRSLFDGIETVAEVCEAGDGREAIAVAQSSRPDLVLLDVRMPGMDGLSALGTLAELAPVVMLTHSDDAAIIAQAMAGGARGYLVHGQISEPDLRAALRICSEGGTVLGPGVAELLLPRGWGEAGPAGQPEQPGPSPADGRFAGLTEREREIMDLIGTGRSNAAIGHELFLAEKTVKNHINRIYDKLGYTTRSEAIADWLRGRPRGHSGH